MLLGGDDLDRAERLDEPRQSLKIAEITKRLGDKLRQLWQLGYQVDKPIPCSRKRWKELTIVLSGGGTRHVAVSSHLNDVNPMSAWPKDETNLTVERHLPKTLELDSQMDDDDGSMFAVANGLAIHRKHWPVIFQSNQIEPLTPTEEIENTSNSYWCLDAK